MARVQWAASTLWGPGYQATLMLSYVVLPQLPARLQKQQLYLNGYVYALPPGLCPPPPRLLPQRAALKGCRERLPRVMPREVPREVPRVVPREVPREVP